jgi:MFS family permease
LRENLGQFSLLVVVNAFVGAMVGLERSILPAIAEREFQLAARTAVLSFIVVFGIAKAFTNYGAGRLSDRIGRKHVLVGGWLVATPVPFLLMWAPDWNWILGANALLGISQGLTWSTTVIMKIDLVGASRRGLAMGLNEFAGYVAVAATAFAPATPYSDQHSDSRAAGGPHVRNDSRQTSPNRQRLSALLPRLGAAPVFRSSRADRAVVQPVRRPAFSAVPGGSRRSA